MSQDTNETNQKSGRPSAAAPGYAAGPKISEIWPLLMALSFVVMVPYTDMATLMVRAVSVVAITFSISCRLCKRRHNSEVRRGGPLSVDKTKGEPRPSLK